MTRRSRLAAAVFALLHLVVAGFGPLADAQLEAKEQQFAAHMESESSQPCAAGHDHLFCQICRVIGVGGNATKAPPIAHDPARLRTLHDQIRTDVVTRLALVSHGPRAPPAA